MVVGIHNRVLHCEVPKIRHSNIVAIQGSESIISSFTCQLHFKLTPLLFLIIDLLVRSFPAFKKIISICSTNKAMGFCFLSLSLCDYELS